MEHKRSETPAYLIWVEERPTMGRGKERYYEAVKYASTMEVSNPITTDDIEIEIAYATIMHPAKRLDADNVNKPTLDALQGTAYVNDRQVRSVRCDIFDKNAPHSISGRVECLERLFYTNKSDVLLIRIYSDSRLLELGGEEAVKDRRYAEWQRRFDSMRFK